MKILNRFFIIFLFVFTATDSIIAQETTLISYNIKYDNKTDIRNNWKDRKYKILTLLKHYKPSIFGIQEGLKNQIKFINDSLNSYAYVGYGRNGKEKGEYSAIFYDSTKFNLKKSRTFWLSETPNSISKGWDAALNRICTYALFENVVSKKHLWVFNTHFDHIGKLARENSAKLILSKIRQLNTKNYPVVLMGDFNTIAKDTPIQLLKTQLDDALEISEKSLNGPIGTFNGFTMVAVTKRIDYFFTKNVTIKFYSHIDDTLNNEKHISDHLPVLISINY